MLTHHEIGGRALFKNPSFKDLACILILRSTSEDILHYEGTPRFEERPCLLDNANLMTMLMATVINNKIIIACAECSGNIAILGDIHQIKGESLPY